MPAPVYAGDPFLRLSIPIDADTITPNDNTDLTTPGVLYVGSGGTLIIRMMNTTASYTFLNVPNGAFLPIMASRVVSTGTTCTGIIALF